jgi:tetrahydromethanopterin S-methyltransferase subunit A
MIVVMTEPSDHERESIKKESGKLEEEPKEVVAASEEREEEKPSVINYKSEDRAAVAKTKIDHTEVTSTEEKIQEKNYKTPDQLLDEDYKVAPTSADEKKVRSEKDTQS